RWWRWCGRSFDCCCPALKMATLRMLMLAAWESQQTSPVSAASATPQPDQDDVPRAVRGPDAVDVENVVQRGRPRQRGRRTSPGQPALVQRRCLPGQPAGAVAARQVALHVAEGEGEPPEAVWAR